MQIQAESQTLERIFTGVSTRYAVPHYQRDYTWNQDQWLELWIDINGAFRSCREYFLGSYVLNTETLEPFGYFEIVDGQQRLTTFTILFAVIRDLARHFADNPTCPEFYHLEASLPVNIEKAKRTAIKAGALVVHLSEPDNYFLRLNDKDHPVFYEKVQKELPPLLNREDRIITRGESRLTKAKKFFTRKVIEDFVSVAPGVGFVELEKFVTFCMTRLILLRIAVASDNDAYLLFETLNDRGLDLSIADLVKNRLLLGCNGDEAKKQRILDKWSQLIERLNQSRFQAHDFLRFYWYAFHSKCTKKELYRLVRDDLQNSDGELLLNNWLLSSEFFTGITDRNLRFPNSQLSLGSTKSSLAELNTLGYSVHLPFLLYLKRNRPVLIDIVTHRISSYLFRIISVGGFSAGRAESRFDSALEKARQGATDEEILSVFSTDPEASDDKFAERIRTLRFEDNKSARLLLAKVHLHLHGEGHPLNQDVHLEHILPQKEDAWPSFNTRQKPREDWVYSIGNMTLLEQALNTSIQASEFQQKVARYKQRLNNDDNGSAIPMTYQIANDFENGQQEWTTESIANRTNSIATLAPDVWPLPSAPPLLEPDADISGVESEDGLI